MGQGLPPIGAEVPQASGLPPIGAEVQPTFRSTNAKDASGNAVVRAAGDVLGGWWENVSPVPLIKAVSSMTADEFASAKRAADKGDYTGAVLHAVNAHPVTTVGKMLINLGKSHWDQVEKAYESAKQGRVSEAAGHGLAAVIPVAGPMAADAGERASEDGWARTTGRALGILTPAALSKALPRRVSVPLRPSMQTTNPVEAAAVQFGHARGIPIDAGTATGSQFVRNVQKRVGGTWGGANTAENAQAASADGLARVGKELAGESNASAASGVRPSGPVNTPGPPATPVSAGQSVLQRFDREIATLNQRATTNYDAIRAAEQQQAARIAQTGGIRGPATASKPFTNVPFAVDVADARAALRPMYDEMMRAAEIAPPMGADARALQALDRLMQGPDSAPLSVVDRALSDLKALDRQWQGPVKEIVKQMDARVRAAAAQAGPKVLKALEDGRAATKQKYAVEEVRDLLSSEPGQVFKQLTANQDTALNRLKAVQAIAPTEIPNVARAYLEDALELATSEGGFGHADRLFANWQKLGGETKRVLFPKAGQIEALDNFFLLAKKIGKNPNPSGTAPTLTATQLLAGIPAWAIAKVLYTPAGVTALTRGARMTIGTAPAVRATGIAQIAKVFQDAGVPVPATAGEDRRDTPVARGSR